LLASEELFVSSTSFPQENKNKVSKRIVVDSNFIPPSNTHRRLGQGGFLHTFTICFPNNVTLRYYEIVGG